MPPSMKAFTQCWKNSSKAGVTHNCQRISRKHVGSPRGLPPATAASAVPGPRAKPLFLDDLAAVDLDQIDAGHALAALLAGGSLLDEGDVAVDALHMDAPQCLGDRRRVGFPAG